jgi:flagellar export protein FliJ
MSTFRFPLQRVLSFRETQLSIEQAALERLAAELRTVITALSELDSRAAREAELVRQSRSFSGSDVAGIARAREWITRERKRLLARMAECEGDIAAKTADVLEAQRKVRLVERLKERRHASFIEDENRALEELAGDSALAGWARDA